MLEAFLSQGKRCRDCIFKFVLLQHIKFIYCSFQDPPKYLPNFKNPCWNESNPGEFTIRCLPYFYLAGFPKCGTTDLFFEMAKHPDFFPARRKEPHWWTRNRFSNAQLQYHSTAGKIGIFTARVNGKEMFSYCLSACMCVCVSLAVCFGYNFLCLNTGAFLVWW